jgi:hypothetical protein
VWNRNLVKSSLCAQAGHYSLQKMVQVKFVTARFLEVCIYSSLHSKLNSVNQSYDMTKIQKNKK